MVNIDANVLVFVVLGVPVLGLLALEIKVVVALAIVLVNGFVVATTIEEHRVLLPILPVRVQSEIRLVIERFVEGKHEAIDRNSESRNEEE